MFKKYMSPIVTAFAAFVLCVGVYAVCGIPSETVTVQGAPSVVELANQRATENVAAVPNVTSNSVAMPIMDMTMQEYASEHGSILNEDEQAAAVDFTGTEPYKPDSVDRKVIGADDRITVSDTFQYPFSAIAWMSVHARCGCSWSGTGFMVLPNVMMTAAHCLCCTKHHESADSISLYFGYQPNGDYAYAYTGPTDYWYGTSFPGGYTDANMDWDVGIVRLGEDVGNQTGYFGMKVRSDNDIDGANLRVAGYRDGLLKYDDDRVDVVNDCQIQYSADAVAGNSGGPVFDGEIATAIHIAENNDLPYNYGRRITEDVFNKVFSMSEYGQPDEPDPVGGGAQDGLVVDPSQTGPDGYVLPKSASHLYTRSELSGLSNWSLYVARNEIAARHGYIFTEDDLRTYFAGKSWYEGTLTSSEFRKIPGILNSTEESNIQTILEIERENHSTYAPENAPDYLPE